MKRVPPDYHISPVGTHAGDRTSKKTVPGAFEVPRKLYGNLSLLGSIPDCQEVPFFFLVPRGIVRRGAHDVRGGFNGSVYTQEGDWSVPLCDAGISVFAVSIQPFVGQCRASGRHEAVRCPAAESRRPTSRIGPSSRRRPEVTECELGAWWGGTRRVDLGGAAYGQARGSSQQPREVPRPDTWSIGKTT